MELNGAELASLFICLYTGWGRILQFVYLSLHWVGQNSAVYLSLHWVGQNSAVCLFLHRDWLGQNSAVCLSVFTLVGAEFCSLFIRLYTGLGQAEFCLSLFTLGVGQVEFYIYPYLHWEWVR